MNCACVKKTWSNPYIYYYPQSDSLEGFRYIWLQQTIKVHFTVMSTNMVAYIKQGFYIFLKTLPVRSRLHDTGYPFETLAAILPL